MYLSIITYDSLKELVCVFMMNAIAIPLGGNRKHLGLSTNRASL